MEALSKHLHDPGPDACSCGWTPRKGELADELADRTEARRGQSPTPLLDRIDPSSAQAAGRRRSTTPLNDRLNGRTR